MALFVLSVAFLISFITTFVLAVKCFFYYFICQILTKNPYFSSWFAFFTAQTFVSYNPGFLQLLYFDLTTFIFLILIWLVQTKLSKITLRKN